MSLRKGLCHLKSHRMVVQCPENRRERQHTKARELGDFPSDQLPDIFHSFISPIHEADFFKDRKEHVVLPLYPQCQAQCLAWSNHSKIFTQKSTQDTSMMTPKCWVCFTEWYSNLGTASFVVGTSLQTNNHAIIVNIFQSCFLKQSALKDGLIFACIFSPMPSTMGLNQSQIYSLEYYQDIWEQVIYELGRIHSMFKSCV